MAGRPHNRIERVNDFLDQAEIHAEVPCLLSVGVGMAEGGPSKDADLEDEDIEVIPRPPENTIISNQVILTEPITGQPKVIVNKAKHVTTGDIYIKNYGRRESRPKKIKPSKPLTTSTQQPSLQDMHYISERLGRRWMKLGRCLKFEDAILEQLDMDFRGNSFDKNYEMLRRWMANGGTKAQLAKCLAECGLGNLADYLAKI